MATDKSKYKATPLSTLKANESQTRNKTGESGDRGEFLKIEDGKNKFRIFPYHPDGGGNSYAETKVVWFLPCDVPKRENGEVLKDSKNNIIVERKNKPIFHAKVHGSSKKDLVDEYKKFCQKLAKENFDNTSSMHAYLSKLTPVKGRGGLSEKTSWVCYANKIDSSGNKKFGVFEFGKAVQYRLDQISANESAKQPMGTDPFTDIEDGRTIVITYNSKSETPNGFYQTELDTDIKPGTRELMFYPIEDSELEKFEEVKSLYSIYRNCYKNSDFEWALQGLKNFDTENKMGVFECEEWLSIVKDMAKEYSSDPSESESEVEEESNGDDFDKMDRSELKAFIKEYNCGIVVMTKTTDDQLRDKLREWKEAQITAMGKDEVEEEEEEVEEEETPSNIPPPVAKKFSEKQKEVNDLPWEKDEKKEQDSISAKDKFAAMKSKFKKQ